MSALKLLIKKRRLVYEVFMVILLVLMLIIAWHFASIDNLSMTIFCCVVLVINTFLYLIRG